MKCIARTRIIIWPRPSTKNSRVVYDVPLPQGLMPVSKEVRRVNIAMHINHRRKNKWRPKHHGRRSYAWHMIYSMKPMRRESWQKRRAQALALMAHGRFDALPQAYRKDIYWNYW